MMIRAPAIRMIYHPGHVATKIVDRRRRDPGPVGEIA
jgi:hypothetical protein